MKKIAILIVTAICLTGCGHDVKPTETFLNSFTENIEVENIEVEEILTETILNEKIS